MALAAGRPRANVGLSDGESLRARNDGFSFWKLPEHWRERVADSIDRSKVQAEHFLFERYIAFIERWRLQRSKLSRGKGDQFGSRLSSRNEVRSRARLSFPRWPCETALIEYWSRWLREVLQELQLNDGCHLASWPNGYKCSIALTHDICNSTDCAQMEAIAELEEGLGFRSAWYLPLRDLECNWGRIELLRSRGAEFGIRGASADGQESGDDREIRRLKPRLERVVLDHELKGFRVPSGCRDIARTIALKLDFESSFCDTDPFESRPGGTCSIFPFFIGRSVELPVTLPRDQTLIHLLRRNPLATWSLKAHWIANAGGMILLATEPKYLSAQPYLSAYKDLLTELAKMDAWHALPSEIAAWWRRRDEATLAISHGEPHVVGPDVSGLVIQKLSETPIFQ
jgi:hypothetical protein